MSDELPRVVLDTVVFVQSLISGRGHSSGCIERLRDGRFVPLLSDATLDELQEVPLRPRLVAKYPFLTVERVSAFIAEIRSLAVQLPRPPRQLLLPRDPKDQPFIDLAVAGGAEFIVTWNERHLTYLMRRDTSEGREFCSRFPNIKILSPPDFLAAIDARRQVSG